MNAPPMIGSRSIGPVGTWASRLAVGSAGGSLHFWNIGGCLLGGWPAAPAWLGWLGGVGQQVDRGPGVGLVAAGVDLRRGEVFVAQQPLDGADVGAVAGGQDLGGEGVPQRVAGGL